MKKKALGKGLTALMSDMSELLSDSSLENITTILIENILPNQQQPRKSFNQESLKELAVSIKENGVLQPIIVSPMKEGKYQIIVGERRFRASQIAGLKDIICIVKDVSDAKILEWGLIENLQREDLNPIEVAVAYQSLLQQFKMTHEEFALYIGKSRTTITNTLRLLKLPPSLQEDVIENKISEGHARALLSLENVDAILEMKKKIIAENLSVRETEQLIRENKITHKKSTKKIQKDSLVKSIEQDLMTTLNTKVVISPKNKNQGKFEIYYSNLQDFERIQTILKTDNKQFYI